MRLLKLVVIYIGLLQVVKVVANIYLHFNSNNFLYLNFGWTTAFITLLVMVVFYEATYRKRYGRNKKRTLLAFAIGFILGFLSSRLYDRWRGWRI